MAGYGGAQHAPSGPLAPALAPTAACGQFLLLMSWTDRVPNFFFFFFGEPPVLCPPFFLLRFIPIRGASVATPALRRAVCHTLHSPLRATMGGSSSRAQAAGALAEAFLAAPPMSTGHAEALLVRDGDYVVRRSRSRAGLTLTLRLDGAPHHLPLAKVGAHCLRAPACGCWR